MKRHVFLVTFELVVDAERHSSYDQDEAATYVDAILNQNLIGADKAENVMAYKLAVQE